MSGFSPLLAATVVPASHRHEKLRHVRPFLLSSFAAFLPGIAIGEGHAQTHTHGSHTYGLAQQRARFCPTNSAPIQSSRSMPRVASPPQTQHRDPAESASHSACCGRPALACSQ
jgi:hypothetical protein